jgi:uncharacterized protein DUF4326
MSAEVKPKRIQRKRTKGWKMPAGAVYVGRPTTWGNPFKVGHRYAPTDSFYLHYGQYLKDGLVTSENCLVAFEAYCRQPLLANSDWLEPLRGKDLACWCNTASECHADVLLRLANS